MCWGVGEVKGMGEGKGRWEVKKCGGCGEMCWGGEDRSMGKVRGDVGV